MSFLCSSLRATSALYVNIFVLEIEKNSPFFTFRLPSPFFAATILLIHAVSKFSRYQVYSCRGIYSLLVRPKGMRQGYEVRHSSTVCPRVVAYILVGGPVLHVKIGEALVWVMQQGEGDDDDVEHDFYSQLFRLHPTMLLPLASPEGGGKKQVSGNKTFEVSCFKGAENDWFGFFFITA